MLEQLSKASYVKGCSIHDFVKESMTGMTPRHVDAQEREKEGILLLHDKRHLHIAMAHTAEVIADRGEFPRRLWCDGHFH